MSSEKLNTLTQSEELVLDPIQMNAMAMALFKAVASKNQTSGCIQFSHIKSHFKLEEASNAEIVGYALGLLTAVLNLPGTADSRAEVRIPLFIMGQVDEAASELRVELNPRAQEVLTGLEKSRQAAMTPTLKLVPPASKSH